MNRLDSVKLTGTTGYYSKDFYISKFIHALTLNYGFYYDNKIFRQNVHFEFNAGIGMRYKKSNRYGILPNEELDFREAYIIRPQHEQDTNGRFITYLEINAVLTVVVPLKK